ncbi:MAG: hypothetical protein COA78_22390 [Blastopirellula sp.]|nr:MAG: hypothetical protein COA78_22390 [Blastopirellula sp.]
MDFNRFLDDYLLESTVFRSILPGHELDCSALSGARRGLGLYVLPMADEFTMSFTRGEHGSCDS